MRKTISRAALGLVVIGICFGDLASAEMVLPPVIVAGFEAYKASGAQAGFGAWLKGSPLEGDKQAQSQSATLVQIESFYGKFTSAVPLAFYEPGPGTMLVYVEMKYERGPLFAKFLTFKAGEKESIVSLKFNTEPDAILPSQLLYKTK
jgi:hypothetical protein